MSISTTPPYKAPPGKKWVQEAQKQLHTGYNTYSYDDIPGTQQWVLVDDTSSTPPPVAPPGMIWKKESEKQLSRGHNTYTYEDIPGTERWVVSKDPSKGSESPPYPAPSGKKWMRPSKTILKISPNTYSYNDVLGEWLLVDDPRSAPSKTGCPSLGFPDVTKMAKYEQYRLLYDNPLTGNRLYLAYMITGKETLKDVVMKEINLESCDPTYLTNVLNEVVILKTIGSKCQEITSCLVDNFLKDKKTYVIVTDYLSNYITLEAYIAKSSEEVRIANALPIMINLMTNVYILHSLGIVHRDLNNRNVMINEKTLDTKIIDFGHSCINYCSIQPGERTFMPPEIATTKDLYGIKYGLKIDIWSLGILLLNLLTGKSIARLYCEYYIKGAVCKALDIDEMFMKWAMSSNFQKEYAALVDYYISGIEKLYPALNKQNWQVFTDDNIKTPSDLLKILLNMDPDKRFMPLIKATRPL